MPSAFSPVREALEGYIAGRINAERLVIAVATEYYGREGRGGGRGRRDGLQPLIEVIDRASPGIVELGSVVGGAGFDVRLAERPFPKEWEADLRRAVETVLKAGERPGKREGDGEGEGEREGEGLIARVFAAVRRLFSAPA
jgi:hypothetical protein